MIKPRIMLTGLRSVLAIAALASSPLQAREWADAGGWTIVESDDKKSCFMMMDYEGPGETYLLLSREIDGKNILGVSNQGWSIKAGDKFTDVEYHLSNAVFSGGTAFGVEHSAGRRGFATTFGSDFLPKFAASAYVHIYRGETLVDRLSLAGSSAALAQLSRCLANIKAIAAADAREKARWNSIPKDPFAKPAATSSALAAQSPARARANLSSLISGADYPEAARRNREEGVVSFSLEVGSNGRTANCTITASSGSSTLDAATCRLLVARARFTPATDSSGNPTTSVEPGVIRWTLPK